MRDWANRIRPYNFSHHSVGANRIRPRLYSPPFAFVHVYIHPIIIRLYHYFIEQMPIGRIRFAPKISAQYIFHHFIQFNGRIRFAPTYLHTYLFRIPYGRIAFAPKISALYIFHHFIHSMSVFDSPLHFATHIYSASRTGESHSPHNISVPNIYSTISSNSMCKCHLSNIFFNNIKDKLENSVAYTCKDLGFSPRKTGSFG